MNCMSYHARISDNNGVIRHIKINISPRCNEDIISNVNISNNGSIYTNPYLITNHRNALALPPILLTNGDALMNVSVLSYFHLGIQCNAVYMPHIETGTDIKLQPPVHISEITLQQKKYSIPWTQSPTFVNLQYF